MTKYVLNSGGLKNQPDLAKKFFMEAMNNLSGQPRLLICCFSQPREDWEKKFLEDKEWLSKLFPGEVFPILELAFPSSFEKQVGEADIVYVRGGDDHLLQYWIKKFDIPKIWEGKVVATSSAGSNVLSKCFWTCDWREVMDGFGILPIKFIAHYESSYGSDDPRGPIDWPQAYNELQVRGDSSLPIHALKEGEYIVIEK